MPGAINPSTISSIVRYLQNIALTLNIPVNNNPEKLQEIVDAIDNFFNKIIEYIPVVPDFDVRVRLILLSFIIPLLIDFLLVWFVGSLFSNVMHIFDVIVFGMLFYEIPYLAFSKGKAGVDTYVIFPVAAIFIGFRIFIWIINLKKRRQKDNLVYIVDKIKDYYMKEVIPCTYSDLTDEKIQDMLEEHSDNLVINEIFPTCGNMSVLLVLLALFVVLFCYGLGVFTPGVNLDDFMQISIMIVAIIFIIILLIIIIMIIFPCCHRPFVKFRGFIRRYGLKIGLLILDFLYIPIATSILENLSYKKDPCGNGQLLYFESAMGNIFDALLDRNVTCIPCSDPSIDHSIRYGKFSPHLQYTSQIWGANGPMILYSIIIFVFGLPICWTYLILQNKAIAWSIPSFGKTSALKWSSLIDKIHSPGLFLFYAYKYNIFFWGIVIPIFKFVIVILTEVDDVWGGTSYLIMLSYLGFSISNIVVQPYGYVFNNVLDSLMAIANTLVTLVPLCAFYNKYIPNWFSIPLTVIIVVFPIIALPYTIFCKRKKVVENELEPGMTFDEDGKVVPMPNILLTVDFVDLMAIWQLEEFKNSNKIFDIQEFSGDQENPEFYSDEPIEIYRDILYTRMTEMYEVIDKLMDATTTEDLLFILNIITVIGASCTGWFFGTVVGQATVEKDISDLYPACFT